MKKIYCSRCGFKSSTEDLDWGGGVEEINGEIYNLYGHHHCSDGGMGYFIDEDISKLQLPPNKGRKGRIC